MTKCKTCDKYPICILAGQQCQCNLIELEVHFDEYSPECIHINALGNLAKYATNPEIAVRAFNLGKNSLGMPKIYNILQNSKHPEVIEEILNQLKETLTKGQLKNIYNRTYHDHVKKIIEDEIDRRGGNYA